MQPKFEFIDKSVFFPESGILAIGDLHIGFEHSIKASGIELPEMQVKDTIGSFQKIIDEIKEKGWKLKKIVFLGDLKHYFGYEWKERVYFRKVTDFLEQYVKDKDIILIKGNHDKFDFSGKKMKDYYFNKGIMFFHGHKSFPRIYEDKVNTWVIGHLHPSVLLRDKQNIKREKFKCFLVGKFKKKNVFVLPSFIGIIEGTSINDPFYHDDDFSIIPYKNLKKFSAYVIGEDKKVLDFGKVGKL